MEDITTKVNTFIHEVPLPILFVGFLGILLLWTFLSMIKDGVAWVFWNVFWYFLPFFLWFFHPQLKPYYVWFWLTGAKTWNQLWEASQEMLKEEHKGHV